MGASTAALELAISLDDKASEGLAKIKEEGGGLSGVLGGLGGAATLAGGGILALGGFLATAAHAANEEQIGMDRLGQALTNNIPGWAGNENAIEGYVSKMEGMAFSDDQVRDSLGSLVARTHDLSEAQKLQAEAMDFARARNIDLQTATDVLGKVYDGNVGVLNRYGVAVAKGTSATDALAMVQKMAGGQAETYANSAAGSMDRLQTAMGDALETVGHSVLDLVSGPLQSIADWFTSPDVQNGIQTVADFIGTTLSNGIQFLGSVISYVSTLLSPFIQAWQTFFSTISSGGDVMGALGQLVQNFGGAFANLWNTVAPILGGLVTNIVNWVVANGPVIGAQLLTWAQAFGQWVMQAVPVVLGQLGGLISQVVGWVQANGPSIMAQLSSWAQAFGQWVVAAVPVLLGQLGGLASQFFGWISAQAQPILAQLGQWAQAFINWVVPAGVQFLQQWPSILSGFLDWIAQAVPPLLGQLAQWAGAFLGWILPMLPGILEGLGGIALGILTFIGETAGTILLKLGDWTAQFFAWVWNNVVPQLPGWLGGIATALWNFITDTAPKLLVQLGQWEDQFFNWVMTNIVPNIPTWLGNIATAFWSWVTSTATDLGNRLVNEWIPKFWNWLTGPGGVKEGIGAKLADAWTSFTTWVTTTAAGIASTVMSIGSNIVEGIKSGISNGWEAFKNWVMGLLGGLVDAVKNFFGIHSPSTVWAAEIGAPMANGIGEGFSAAWAGVADNLLAQLDGTWGAANERVKQIADMERATREGTGVGSTPGYGGGASNPVYTGGGASSGGSGARSMATGFGFGGGFGGSGGGVNIGPIYITAGFGADGHAIGNDLVEELEARIAANVRTRRGGF